MDEIYLPQFYAMVDQLNDHPDITITDIHFPDPASSMIVQLAKDLFVGSFPEGMEAFYREMDGFHLEWECSREAGAFNWPVVGAIEILPLSEVLKDWHGVTWFDFEEGERFKAVKPLDFFVEEACSALLYSEEAGFSRTIYYHQLGEALFNTGYDFYNYIERLVAARGFWYWVETLCPETRESPQARNFFIQMPLLFEDFNPELFVPGSLK